MDVPTYPRSRKSLLAPASISRRVWLACSRRRRESYFRRGLTDGSIEWNTPDINLVSFYSIIARGLIMVEELKAKARRLWEEIIPSGDVERLAGVIAEDGIDHSARPDELQGLAGAQQT